MLICIRQHTTTKPCRCLMQPAARQRPDLPVILADQGPGIKQDTAIDVIMRPAGMVFRYILLTRLRAVPAPRKPHSVSSCTADKA